jgi:ribosomal protein S18 acetylase RimI-like enzyme
MKIRSARTTDSVVSTNTPAVTLWKKLGFEIVGTVPGPSGTATTVWSMCT